MPNTVDSNTNNKWHTGFYSQMKLFPKRSWTSEEDELLISIVDKLGAQKWSQIARFIPNRTGKQCRERWVNQLNPNINRQEWNFNEEWILFLAYHVMGSKWSRLSTFLPGRTDNSIKNHWNSIMRKKISQLEHKFSSQMGGLNKQGIYLRLVSLTNLKKIERQVEESQIQTKEQSQKIQASAQPILCQLTLKESSESDELSFINILKTIDEKANIELQRKQSYQYNDFGLKSADKTKNGGLQSKVESGKNQMDKENYLGHILQEKDDYLPLPPPFKKLSSLDCGKFSTVTKNPFKQI